jgi:predicted DNA-binding transcriptional regulator YafY
MQWGAEAEVLEPNHLRDEVAKTATGIARIYRQ